MSMGRKQGEQVSLSYSNAALAAVQQINVFDSNGSARPLQSYERLILDVISFDTEANDTTNLAYIISGATAPTAPASGSVPADPIVATFTVAQGLPDQGFVAPAEGFSIPVGNNLYLVVPGTGLSGSVALAGTGRIINGKTRGVSAGYKALLTPGGAQQVDGV